ncbi:hypothetical protein HYDPIDRAFT_119735 [Hydnomerulius pinastri MD-312]|uniref:Uncharacterized protein n=1 Tax=Hydnomerulius pinastri MD-312 TaxID=994086 RepID=A0A0C9VY25_9AGAM|nr:hypothetical protein HYDPIDRAFT_119735 [Hydnomerulius pinastri MD-312]
MSINLPRIQSAAMSMISHYPSVFHVLGRTLTTAYWSMIVYVSITSTKTNRLTTAANF